MGVALLLPMELVAMHVYIPLGIPCLQTADAQHNYEDGCSEQQTVAALRFICRYEPVTSSTYDNYSILSL